MKIMLTFLGLLLLMVTSALLDSSSTAVSRVALGCKANQRIRRLRVQMTSCL